MQRKNNNNLKVFSLKVFSALLFFIFGIFVAPISVVLASDGNPPELYISSEPPSFVEYCQADYGTLDFSLYAVTDDDPTTLSLDYVYNGDTHNISSPDSVSEDTGYFSVSVSCDDLESYSEEEFRFTVYDSDGEATEERYIEMGAAGDDTVPSITFNDIPPTYIESCEDSYGTLYFSFEVYDHDNLDNMSVEFGYLGTGHGLDPAYIDYQNGYAQYEYWANCDEFEPGEVVNFSVHAYDNDGLGSQEFDIEFGGGNSDDYDAPDVIITTEEGIKSSTFIVEGTVNDYNDVSNIVNIDWWVDSDGSASIDPLDEVFDSPNEEFRFEVSGLSEGPHQITVRAYDSNGNSNQSTINVDVDSTPPVCTGWTNLPNPVYSDELTYSNISCTDNRGIADARYRVYHYNYGDVYDDVQVLPTDEEFDSDTEQFSFTITLPAESNQDGPMSVFFRVYDEAGNSSYDEDPIVVDYEDQTAPIVNLTAITPDPLADTTPTITGSCVDNTFRETNSNINVIEVRVDGGMTHSISPLDGNFDSHSEHFNYTTDELSLGEHEIEVTCTDAANNSSSAVEEFEIVAQDEDAEPGAFDYQEQFEDDEFQDVPNTTLVWGNGRLRLREDISIQRTPIDTENFRVRYAADYNDYTVVPGVTSDTLWYSKENTVARYNIANDQITTLNHSDFGVSNFGTVNTVKEFSYQGKNYLVITSDSDIFLLNLTDTTGVQHYGHGGAGSVVPDVSRGRFGMYLSLNWAGGSDTSLAYWDLKDTFADTSDDEFTVFPEDASAFAGRDIVGLVKGFEEDELYIGSYNHGLYRFTDNNTPTDFDDDEAAHYSYGDVFNAVTFDPDGKAIFGTANVDNGEVYVVLDDGGTPYDSSDDTVKKIANARQVGYKDIFGLTYLGGQNDVGDQIIIKTETGNIVYFNFNSTYENLNDDTFIELPTDGGVRPSVSNVYAYDYDTFFVAVDVQGLYKVELTRGWVDSGQAVGLPPRPPQTLLVNNFTADAITLDPLAKVETDDSMFAQLVPQAYAAGEDGITYEVSVDDGVNWEEVTLGELRQLAENDYRLQFRIGMEEQEGTSPALSSYSLNFGGYVNEEQVNEMQKFGVSVSPGSSQKNSDFTVTVEAQDILGHRVSDYSGVVNLQLVTSSDVNAQSSFNTTQVTLVNGVGSVGSARVSETGQFKVNASASSFSGQSGTFMITDTVVTTPTMSFTSNNYEPYKGQTFTLSWETTHLTTLTLNPGNHTVSTTGSQSFAVNQDTTYTLFGTGPDGSLSSTITIEVKDEPAPSVSPSPSASPSPTPSGTPGPSPSVSPSPSPSSTPNPDVSPTPGVSPTPSASPTFSTESNSSGNSRTTEENDSDSEESSGGIFDIFNDEQPSKTELSLIVSDDLTIIKGEKVSVSWEASNADSVIVDHFGKEMARKGSFEFYPNRTQKIKITARKGDKTIEKVVTITVKELPGFLANIVPPSLTPLVSTTLKWSGSAWLIVLALLFLLGFNKRRPKKQDEMPLWKRVGYMFSTVLWIISPVIILLAVVAAAFFTTPWLIVVALLCTVVFLRRIYQWFFVKPEKEPKTLRNI